MELKIGHCAFRWLRKGRSSCRGIPIRMPRKFMEDFFLKDFLRPVINLSTGLLSGLKEHLSLSYWVRRGAAHLVSDQLDRSLNSLSRSTPCFSEPWELSAARRSVFQRFTEVKLLAGIMLFVGFSTSGSSEGLCLRWGSIVWWLPLFSSPLPR